VNVVNVVTAVTIVTIVNIVNVVSLDPPQLNSSYTTSRLFSHFFVSSCLK
jgi:hypothetical protein